MSLYQNDPELSSQLGFTAQEADIDIEPEPAPSGPGYDHSLDWRDINRKFKRPAGYSGLGAVVLTQESDPPMPARLEPLGVSVVAMIHAMYAHQKHAIEQGHPMTVDELNDSIPADMTLAERALMERHINHLVKLTEPQNNQPKSLLERLEQRKRGQPIATLALLERTRSNEKPISHAGIIDTEALMKEIKTLREVGKASKSEIIDYLENDARHLTDEQAQTIGVYVESLYAHSDDHKLVHY